MIDPHNCSIFTRSQSELEEFAVFSVCVAGKTATTVAKQVNNMCKWYETSPDCGLLYKLSYRYAQNNQSQLADRLKSFGIGCQNAKARTLIELAKKVHGKDVKSELNLKTCKVEELEEIWGIGAKTARFFILHTRPNQRVAVLDTHILYWLSKIGYENVPKSTPGKGSFAYKSWEQTFLYEADKRKMTPAALDLSVWSEMSLTRRKTKV